MVKMLLLFRRKPELTSQQFREHYEKRHVPLALQLLPYFKDYRRNYVRKDISFDAAKNPNATPDYDVLTELTFKNREEFERMSKAMTDPVISKTIGEDEERFMDRSASLIFFVDEVVTPQDQLKQFALDKSQQC